MAYEIFTATIPANTRGSDFGPGDLAYRATGKRFETDAEADRAGWQMVVAHNSTRTNLIFTVREV